MSTCKVTKAADVLPRHSSGHSLADIRVVVGPETSGSTSVQINWVRIEPSGGAAEHVHDSQDHGYFVIDGNLRLRAGEDEFDVGPETGVYIPAGVPHSLRVVGDRPIRMVGFFAPAEV